VIALVIGDGEMIHIVRQTYNEVIACWDGRHFFEWYLMLNKDVAKNSNVNFDGWEVRELKGLALRKEMAHLGKKIISNSNEQLLSNPDFRGKGILRFPRDPTMWLSVCDD